MTCGSIGKGTCVRCSEQTRRKQIRTERKRRNAHLTLELLQLNSTVAMQQNKTHHHIMNGQLATHRLPVCVCVDVNKREGRKCGRQLSQGMRGKRDCTDSIREKEENLPSNLMQVTCIDLSTRYC